MPTSTQTQLRRGTSTQVAAMTPAAGEAVVNTTDKRVHLGDGTTAGGIPHATAQDVQNQTFQYAAVGGTANAITLTHVPARTAYAAGQRSVFKATASSSTAVTVNSDGLGSRSVKMMVNGVLTALDATNKIVSGGMYELLDDGTQLQLQCLGRQTSTGGLAYLGSVTATASSTVDLTSLMSATYDDYVVLFDNVIPTSGLTPDLLLRCSPDNSTFAAGSGDYAYVVHLCNSASSTVSVVRSASATAVVIASGLPNVHGCSGRIDVYGANSSSVYRTLTADAAHIGVSTLTQNRTAGTWFNTASPLQALRFLMSTGTIASGTFRLYGVAKS